MEIKMSETISDEAEYKQSSLSLSTFILVLVAIALGMLCAALLLPGWLPNLTSSLVGTNPKGYWYISRGSAFVSLGLLWLSMIFGITSTNKMAKLWPGGPAAFAIHEFTSLLGLAFVLFHALVLLGDHYINYTLAQIFIPFASVGYHPLWVGLGQLGFYVGIIVSITFYIRRRIGQKTWRGIHFAGYLGFLLAFIHGIASGTDSNALWAQQLYWGMGIIILFLFFYRLLTGLGTQKYPEPAKSINS
jgi:predicted ferric reductase